MFKWILLGITVLFVSGMLALLARLSAGPSNPVESTASATPSALTPTYCPVATPEPFYVEPETSPTYIRFQTIAVYLGNSEAITVTAESGEFSIPCDSNNCPVRISLLPNVVHHLTVYGKVRTFNNGCTYGGYTLSTTRDRYGKPLIILSH